MNVKELVMGHTDFQGMIQAGMTTCQHGCGNVIEIRIVKGDK